jgi:hypothetical protein
MVWFQVNIPLVVGCLLMAALMDLRLFKFSLLVASIVLMFLAAGVIIFGRKLGLIQANAVAVLSVMVWLGSVVSVIRRWFHSKRPYEAFGSKADRMATFETALLGGAGMLDTSTVRLTSEIVPEFHFNRLISGQSGSRLDGVVLGEVGSEGPAHLVRLHGRDGNVPPARTFDPGILQIAIWPSQVSPPATCQDKASNSAVPELLP